MIYTISINKKLNKNNGLLINLICSKTEIYENPKHTPYLNNKNLLIFN